MIYPKAEKIEKIVNYFGVDVEDNYTSLEDLNCESTKKWIDEENKLTEDFLSQCERRDFFKERVEKLLNYERVSMPIKKGKYTFFFKNDGLQDQSILYVKTNEEDEKILINPNEFSKDGSEILTNICFSNNGKYVAYCVAKGGSDWADYYVFDVEKKEVLEDKVEYIRSADVFFKGEGFFYVKFDSPNSKEEEVGFELINCRIYYHKLGTSQDEDEVIFDSHKRNLELTFSLTDDERFLSVYTCPTSNGNGVYVKDLDFGDDFVEVVKETKDTNFVMGSFEDDLFLYTSFGANNKKLVKFNLNDLKFVEVLPEQNFVLNDISFVGGKIIATYLENASSKVKVFDLKGNFENEIELPTLGTVRGFGGSMKDKECYFIFTSFTYPLSIFKYDIENKNIELVRKPSIDFDSSLYETKQIFYSSKDGTKVPMFLTYKKGLEFNGENKCLMYGYGGFNISLEPHFSVSRIPFLEDNGIYVVVNLRGGGEFGEEWYNRGKNLNKQNVFDDFIYAGKYLVENNYTCSSKLAIHGGSNGGLLVGACSLQEPELFGAGICEVGVLDMLKFHLTSEGRTWCGDYGCCENEEEFLSQIKYSPVHNIKEEKYPALLVKTGDRDDRVVPYHSYKFIAELQEKGLEGNPYLLKVSCDSGHSGAGLTKQIEEIVDNLCFLDLVLK